MLNINDHNSYQEFLNYKRGMFSNRREYDEAKKLNISTREELINFTESGFESYKTFLEVKKFGFTKKTEYYESKKMGFERYDEYQEFLKSGCKTKEDFEFFKEKLPNYIKKIEATVYQTLKDADNAFKSDRLEEFIRLKFLSIEKLTEALYLKLFRKDIKYENDMKVDDFIAKIEKKLNLKIIDSEEIKYWRRIRNKIIHQNLKIKLDKAEKGKEFFDEIYGKLDEIYKNL